MKKFFAALTLVTLTFIFAGSAHAQDKPKLNLDKASTAKLISMLEASGYNYAKAADNVWTIKFKGNELPEFNVVIIGHEGMIILLTVIAEKKDLKPSPEFYQKLLKFNDDFDRVKFGIDDDGDLFTRIDLSLRIVDLQELKLNLEQISAAVDEAYVGLKPYLNKKN